jgi:hypothetical protein
MPTRLTLSYYPWISQRITGAALAQAVGGFRRLAAYSARAADAPPVIGFLGGTSPEVYADRLRAFRQGLKEGRLCRGRKRRDRISLGREPS